MIGGLVLACAFSCVLAIGAIIRSLIISFHIDTAIGWLGGSLTLMATFGVALNMARVREVGYTYLNLIIADHKLAAKRSDSGPAA